jgi:hypothetical protein
VSNTQIICQGAFAALASMISGAVSACLGLAGELVAPMARIGAAASEKAVTQASPALGGKAPMVSASCELTAIAAIDMDAEVPWCAISGGVGSPATILEIESSAEDDLTLESAVLVSADGILLASDLEEPLGISSVSQDADDIIR